MRKFVWQAALAAVAVLVPCMASSAAAQGVTTAAVTGRVLDQTTGGPLSGVQVIISNQATGTQQGTITRADGRYIVAALRPGGPYRIEARQIGYRTSVIEGVQLALGQAREANFALETQAVELQGVEVTAQRVQTQSDGISTVVGETAVANAPSVGRELADLIRYTPQAKVLNDSPDGAAISIAGQSNRNNAMFIDGVVNNDVFGLAASGTNGGQTGAPPISFDAIDQMQIAISPFDVTQSGFVGGAINVVTRSGTNSFEGSAYYQLRNESLTGKTPGTEDRFTGQTQREQVPDFSTQRYGFRLGGPVVEDKLFFFVNGELYRSETPQLFNASLYEGDFSVADLGGLRDFLMTEVGFDPGGFESRASSLDDNKLLGKLDWQINNDHRLWLRHSYSFSDNVEADFADVDEVFFSTNNEVFPSTTNSTALELTSRFGSQFVNKLILGTTFVSDDRGIQGDPFPEVTIQDGGGDITLGSDAFSTGNLLDQDIFTLTNNLTAYLGGHTLTLGTHNEFYRIENLFLRQNFGDYTYANIADFQQSVCAAPEATGQSAVCQALRAQGPVTPARPINFQRGYSALSGRVGDEATEAAAMFDAYQLGFYVQDQFRLGDRLQLTAGVRMEIPGFLDDPNGPSDFESTTLPLLRQSGLDLGGARAGQTPEASPIFAPRIGFTYDVDNAGTQLRGGVGVFNGRQQFVYPGAMFTNNGTSLGFYSSSTLPDRSPVPFAANPQNLPGAAEFGEIRGELDLFTKDFEYPRVLRTSAGVDTRLPFGFTGTLEGQYTKTLAGLTVQNVNFRPLNDRLSGPDNRQVYNYGYSSRFNSFDVNALRLDPRYTSVLVVGNTEEGYSYDVSASVNRAFGESLIATASYTYGDAYSINDLTSSQIFSIWRFNPNINGLNNLEPARSTFSLGHRLLGQLTYRQEFLDNLATTISAVYTGESGRPYTFLVGNSFGFTGEGSGTSPLAYIPRSASDLTFQDYSFRNRAGQSVTVTAAEQVQAFDSFIGNTEYLADRRGSYAERNAMRAPFENVIDLKIAQEVFGNIAGRRNGIELTLDILNFTNLLNSEWGRRYNVGFRTVDLVRFERFNSENDLTPVYTFRLRDGDDFAQNMDDYWDNRLIDFGSYGSRWLMQLGARYTF